MKPIFITLLFVLLIGCTNSLTENNEHEGRLKFSLSKVEVPDDVTFVDVTLTKNGNEPLTKQLNLLSDNTAEVYFNNLEIGIWHLTVEASNSNNEVRYSGEQDLDIEQGIVTTVNIQLNPVVNDSGGLYIYTEWTDLAEGWTHEPSNPIITKTSETYQKFGVSQPFVLYDEGIYKMWYAGLVNSGVTYIFYATSTDGIQWEQYGSTPVLSPGNGTWDAGHVSTGPVIKEDGIYKMYYNGWSSQYSNWSVGLATSTDGIHWQKYGSGPVFTSNSWDKQIVATSLIKIDSTYHLYYGGMANNSYLFKMGVATSTDGINWNRFDFPIMGPTQNWENGTVYYGTVIFEDNIYKMIYLGGGSGNGRFGIAYSKDGITWVKFFDEPFFYPPESNSPIIGVYYPQLLKVQGGYNLYYTGTDINGILSVCLARKFTN